jgi:hypothetical protein
MPGNEGAAAMTDPVLLRTLSEAADLLAQCAGYMNTELTSRLGGGRPGFFFEDGLAMYREAGVLLEKLRELTKGEA